MAIFRFFLALLAVSNLFAESDFDRLMGKETKHWRHVQQAEDLQFLDLCRGAYDKNRAHLFEKSGGYKIPQVVHFIWVGPRPFPAGSVENVRTWMAKNPAWKFKFWTDRPRSAPCEGMETIVLTDYPFPFLKRCYESSKNWGEKSDVLRFEILYAEGGAYADHDANCLQSFDGLHRGLDFYCCLETPHTPFVGRNVTAGNGVIGSRAGHPVVKEVIDIMEEHWDDLEKKYAGDDSFSRTQIVMERTYIALTLALKRKVDLPGNTDIVLPAAYFFSKPGIQPLYSKHFYANSWADDGKKMATFEKSVEKELSKIDRKMWDLYLILLAAVGLNSVLIGFWLILARKKVKS